MVPIDICLLDVFAACSLGLLSAEDLARKCCGFDPQQFVGKDCHACTDTRADGSAFCDEKDPCAK